MTLYSLIHSPTQRKIRRGLLLVAAALVTTGSAFMYSGRAQAAACAAPTTDYGTATSTIKIDNAATYRVWSRMLAPDANSNSYALEIDGTNCYIVGDAGLTAGTWTWVDFQSGQTGSKISRDLTVGDHTIKMIGREAGVKL